MEFHSQISKAYLFRFLSLFRKSLKSAKISQKQPLKKYWFEKIKKTLELYKKEILKFHEKQLLKKTLNTLKYHRHNQIKKKRLNYKLDIIFEKNLLKRIFKRLKKTIFSSKYGEIFRLEHAFRFLFFLFLKNIF